MILYEGTQRDSITSCDISICEIVLLCKSLMLLYNYMISSDGMDPLFDENFGITT